MSSASWHARISCGRDTGAGFLVTEQHVLTCAHVVARSDTETVAVSFAHGGYEQVPARVVAHGGWDGRESDPGDLAVLELDRPVPMKPAEFATPTDAYGDPPRRLLAYGFPKRYDEGTLAEYRATAQQLIAGEWVQLESWAAHGQPLAPGFSGAAVTLADTGRVVGMVSAAARSPEIRNGRMLPTQIMARYWPRLADLIPTPTYDQHQKETLRHLLEHLEQLGCPQGFSGARGTARPAPTDPQTENTHTPERLYQDAVGPLGPPLPPHGFTSLWDAAWYLLSEVQDPEAVTRFTTRLADFVDDTPTRTALRAWPATPQPHHPAPHAHAPAPAPAGTAGPAHSWSPILVEIAPSGSGDGAFLVEVSAYNGRHRRVVGSRRLPVDRVRPYTLERIDEAYRELELGARELIAFVLPRRWLNTDVAHWQRSADDDSPLGSFAPLVVMDLERRRSGGLQHKLRQKWQHLDALPTARLHRIDCWSVGQDQVKLTIGLRRDADMVGFATPPRADRVRRLFQASLNAAVPVMLWPRTGCRGEHRCGETADCRGSEFLDRLAAHLSNLPPRELPRHIHELRETAYASDAPEPHWAYDLALLWEDPECLPDPAGYLHNPVG
ncbi:serine protease [Streptomyces dioscori]|uniref:Serine protease n=1 Tax=Streptomyces dioscori TaxID=2109333 RepID=A0A2P8Q4J9_9ACTN|nr:trypsin-like peptidase domain-containing protein [Streptomyces dioscori]PSM41178.1 serine protease [Streptomyces dioscori]